MTNKKKDSGNEIPPYETVSAWETLTDTQSRLLEKRIENYVDFLKECKTERETIEYVVEKAKKMGFKPLAAMGTGKKLKPGAKVYFINKNRALCLAIIGKRPAKEGFKIIAAHHDVPRIDIKPQPLYAKHGLAMLKTHYYGGIKNYQWAAIPIALHGFAITSKGKKVSFRIGEDKNDPVFSVTDVAPHLSHKIQDSRKSTEVLKGEELNLVIGNKPSEKGKKEPKPENDRLKNTVLVYLRDKLGLTEEDFAWAEVHAVPAFTPRDVGFDRSLLGGYGHDDRACVMASFEAIASVKIPEHTAAIMLLDKEEIGSCGASGASSMMVTDFLGMLVEATSGERSFMEIRRAISETRVFSADTSTPIDPTFEATSDPMNSGVMGKGVWVSKYSGSHGKFMSSEADVEFMAEIRKLFTDAKIPYQFGEMGKVDEGGGGTVAFLLANMNMHVIDIALPTLSLHSPFEIISKVDYHYTVSAYKAFLEKKH